MVEGDTQGTHLQENLLISQDSTHSKHHKMSLIRCNC